MDFPPCDVCVKYDSKLSVVLRRLWTALRARLGMKTTPRNPRFMCLKCKVLIPEKQVQFLGTNGRSESAAPQQASAFDESFLGDSYHVACHGTARIELVTLVSQLVGTRCHHNAFWAPNPNWKPWIEDEEMKTKRLAQAAKNAKIEQAKIAQARRVREEWDTRRSILLKINELKELVNTLPITDEAKKREFGSTLYDLMKNADTFQEPKK